MQVKLDWFVVFSVVLFLVCVSTEPVFCQSVAVQVPAGLAGAIESKTAWPPNTMSAEMRRWEAILDMTYPSRFHGKLTGRELVEEMNRLGLPTILSGSAKDDSLDFDNEIELPLPNSSLRTRLFAGLKEVNATFWCDESRIEIISLDDAEQPEYFFTVTYDVTSLVHKESYDLIDSITASINPDGWMDTGQGLATIVANEIKGRHLITISHEYASHRRVQRLLNGINRLSGSCKSSARSGGDAVPGGSKAVALPSRRIN